MDTCEVRNASLEREASRILSEIRRPLLALASGASWLYRIAAPFLDSDGAAPTQQDREQFEARRDRAMPRVEPAVRIWSASRHKLEALYRESCEQELAFGADPRAIGSAINFGDITHRIHSLGNAIARAPLAGHDSYLHYTIESESGELQEDLRKLREWSMRLHGARRDTPGTGGPHDKGADDEFMPARWFQDEGRSVKPSTLRAAAAKSRGAVRTRGEGKQIRYSVQDAWRLWPSSMRSHAEREAERDALRQSALQSANLRRSGATTLDR